MSLFAQYSNVLLIGITVVAGVVVPDLGPFLQPFVPLLVVFLIYSLLREFRLQEVDITTDIGLILLSLGISHLMLPLVGVSVGQLVLSETAVLGFIIVFAAPTTAVSAIWTGFSNGDVELATTITVGSMLATPVVAPVVLIWLTGSQATVPVVVVLTELGVVVGGGILLTVFIPQSMLSERSITVGAMGALMIIIYVSTAIVDIVQVELTDLFAVVGVSAVLLAVGVAVSIWLERTLRFDRIQTTPLFFTSSMKNLGIALLISNHTQSNPLIIATIVTYFICQQLFGAFVTDHVS